MGEQTAVLGVHKSLYAGVVDGSEQGVKVMLGVEQADRLAVQADLRPGEHLEQLFKSTIAARQGNKSIRDVHQAGFACVHAVHDFQARQPVVHQGGVGEHFGDHADHLAPGLQRAICHRAHHTSASGAISQDQPALGDALPHFIGCLQIGEAHFIRRAAVDTHYFHESFLFGENGGIIAWRCVGTVNVRTLPVCQDQSLGRLCLQIITKRTNGMNVTNNLVMLLCVWIGGD